MAMRRDDLKRSPIEDLHLVGGPIADVAEFAARVESDIVGVAQSLYLAGQRAGFHVHHLHHATVRDVEAVRLGIHGEVVPVARAAEEPGVLDDEGRVGQLSGPRRFLGLRSDGGQQA